MSNFRDLWAESELNFETLDENHNYSVGTDEAPVFVRVDKFDEAMPHPALLFEGPLPTKENPMPEVTKPRHIGVYGHVCGATLSTRRPARDEWKEWHKARRDYLLGGKRVARTGRGYTVFPEDKRVNDAILGCANKYVAANIDRETGLPCEEFRDLAAHLASSAIERTVERGFHWAHIDKHAAAYLRKLRASDSITTNQLRNKGLKI